MDEGCVPHHRVTLPQAHRLWSEPALLKPASKSPFVLRVVVPTAREFELCPRICMKPVAAGVDHERSRVWMDVL